MSLAVASACEPEGRKSSNEKRGSSWKCGMSSSAARNDRHRPPPASASRASRKARDRDRRGHGNAHLARRLEAEPHREPHVQRHEGRKADEGHGDAEDAGVAEFLDALALGSDQRREGHHGRQQGQRGGGQHPPDRLVDGGMPSSPSFQSRSQVKQKNMLSAKAITSTSVMTMMVRNVNEPKQQHDRAHHPHHRDERRERRDHRAHRSSAGEERDQGAEEEAEDRELDLVGDGGVQASRWSRSADR